ncbi:phage tail protein [Pseudomonas aeruginosa]|uniref:phage tail protein n=1 Tax=Pseudomonas aeruginosa TaxID=287 RepID=UPI00106DBBE2|nr:phage tail protein [Pseudomonas aeruginosa]MBI7138786.1 phage tail protein [Pseudomonas aeruginosa]MCO3228614.1 phage tail protein [Pseudomonas aeruginosa]MDP5590522.1 phage tail protein [Pseudomonas aeruginosa]HCF9514009.1 phage tail protein [Pseudomonas aeruginosa]
MAIETFTWTTESGGEGDITFATRSAQFGDGYKQLVSEGLNSKSQSWPVSITGPAATIKAAMDFLDRHAGARAFLWTPPLGGLGFYTCAGYRPVNLGGRVYRLTATFEQAFHP